MGYINTRQCLDALEARGELVRIDTAVDARIEVGAIQRRVFLAGGPALLFTNVKGCRFPMAANIYGTRERMHFIFRDTIATVRRLMKLKLNPMEALRHPLRYLGAPRTAWHTLPRSVGTGPVMEHETTISALPQLVSWPMDGGGYVTLPQVYTESPDNPGYAGSNMGMYRVQLTGNDFLPDREVGLHYQIHRGIGHHHAQALAKGQPLRVNVFVGGPPAMTLAAVMPLPEGLAELFFAGAMAGHRIPMVSREGGLPIPAQADFCICGMVMPGEQKPEGPFGDHLGYYSLTHDFPVMRVDRVFHRSDAIWPFTTVGRPPQEDTVFGEFIHEMTAERVPSVFSGVHEVH
ncbi:MAG: UbiD family decarboxylase, partial [Proteobacteria bacterium]|nr:UbiD family decarboxylase [Pseudomonadota bacterium]